jgi:type I restriction enzyme S subunit
MAVNLDELPLPDELPVIPDGWRYESLADLVEERGLSYGIVQPGSETTDGVPIVRVNNIRNGRIDTTDMLKVTADIEAKFQRSRLRGGEVLLTLVGTLGEVAIVPDNLRGWNVARAVGVIPVRKDPGSLWVSICLRSAFIQHCIRTWATTTVQATFNLRDLAKLPIPIPPTATREAIAAVLGSLDDKIELNRRMNATLEAMARALFQSWFVDFDPVRAKLDGRPPAALDPATAALFPEHFAHGEHAMLPVGWRLAAIEEVCAINAWTLGKNDDLPTLEYVEISEVSRGNIANIATYPRGEEPSRARRRLRHGDTVLSTVRPDRGSYFLALNPPENRVASTGFAVLTPTKVPWSFLHAALTQPEVSDHLGQMADGGAYPAVRPEIIGAMQVTLPNEPKILEAFHRTCAPLFEQAEANRIQSRTLATLRDTLLPKLLSGELSVAGATDTL